MLQTTALALLAAAALLALPCLALVTDPSVLARHPALRVWRQEEAPPAPGEPHTLLLAVRQQNLDLLRRAADEVSDPRSPRYGKHLSVDQITQMVAPRHEDLAAVQAWALSHGADPAEMRLVKNRDVLRVRLPVRGVESMMNVTMRRFRHPDGRAILRSLVPLTLPPQLRGVVEHVHGVNDLPLLRPRRGRPAPRVPSAGEVRAALRDGSNAPVVGGVVSRGTTDLTFVPVCQDGTPAPAGDPLCSSNPPSITGLTLSASFNTGPRSGGSTVGPVDVDPSTCSVLNGVLSCSVHLGPDATGALLPTAYDQFTVSVTQNYDGGDASDTADAPFPVMSVPPVTPATIKSLYGIPQGARGVAPNNSISVVEFEQQYYTPDDLVLYLRQNGLRDSDAASVRVVGPNDATNPGVEANLDIQVAMGVAGGVPMTFWSILANSTEEIDDILSWAYAVGNTTDAPLVSSLSYGMSANQVDTYLGAGYLARSDVEFQKLAARGLTVIIASGDTGAGDLGQPPMSNPTCATLHPDWPSQSPYVTSVGSTMQTVNDRPICYLPAEQGGVNCDSDPVGEVAASLEQGCLFTGGGGFAFFPGRPSYQDLAVEAFFNASNEQQLLPPPAVWNASGRGYPDVVALGHNFAVAQQGSFIAVDGTSASAPVFAAVVALLNDARLQRGGPPLGFLNPWLYQTAQQNPAAFRDVAVGSNRCGVAVQPGDTVPNCCDAAFHALPGWDAVTGLGAPFFPEMVRSLF